MHSFLYMSALAACLKSLVFTFSSHTCTWSAFFNIKQYSCWLNRPVFAQRNSWPLNGIYTIFCISGCLFFTLFTAQNASWSKPCAPPVINVVYPALTRFSISMVYLSIIFWYSVRFDSSYGLWAMIPFGLCPVKDTVIVLSDSILYPLMISAFMMSFGDAPGLFFPNKKQPSCTD